MIANNNILDLILKNIGQGVIALDNQNRILSCNKRAEDDLEFEQLESACINTVIKNKKILDGIVEAVSNNAFISLDIERSDGEIFELSLLPVQSSSISIIITTKEVTEMRKAARAQRDFFANASHELYTPLSSIMGYSEMLAKGIFSKAETKEFSEIILNEGSRMKLLLEGMLKVSELEGNKKIVDEKINLAKVVQNVIKAARPKAMGKKITLQAKVADSFIFANEEKITEVVTNLVDNAIKYTPEGGAVTASVQISDSQAVLQVTDNGIGIPADSLSRMYERFYRVDKGRSKAEGGMGLGLPIVKQICSYYKAPIKIQSKLGVGTTVSITFKLDL